MVSQPSVAGEEPVAGEKAVQEPAVGEERNTLLTSIQEPIAEEEPVAGEKAVVGEEAAARDSRQTRGRERREGRKQILNFFWEPNSPCPIFNPWECIYTNSHHFFSLWEKRK